MLSTQTMRSSPSPSSHPSRTGSPAASWSHCWRRSHSTARARSRAMEASTWQKANSVEVREVSDECAAQGPLTEALWGSGTMKGLRSSHCHQPGREAGETGSLKVINPLLSPAVYKSQVWTPPFPYPLSQCGQKQPHLQDHTFSSPQHI